jgi:hypothetical protein
MKHWTETAYYAPEDRHRDGFDAETRRKQRERNDAERVHEESNRTDGVIEQGPTVPLADLLGISKPGDDVPPTISGETRNAMFGIPVYAPAPSLSPEDVFRRDERDARVSSATRKVEHVRDRLAEIARAKP